MTPVQEGEEGAEDFLLSAVDAEGNIWVLRANRDTALHVADLFRTNDYTRVTISRSGSDPD